MRVRELWHEAMVSALAAKVSTTLVAVVVAAMCVVATTTVGRNAANEAAIDRQFTAAGARTLTFTENSASHLMTPAAFELISELSTVDDALGLSRVVDVTNGLIGPGGTKVPAWEPAGQWAGAVTLTAGRFPTSGEAIVGSRARGRLGLATASGFVTDSLGRQWPIVGAFQAKEPFDDVNDGVLINGEGEIASIQLLVGAVSQVEATQRAAISILAPSNPDDLVVDSAVSSAQTAQRVGHQVQSFGRVMLGVILAAGAFFVAVVVLADGLIRRRELGRRRTLGATRFDIVLLGVVRVLLPAGVGALVGSVVGWIVTMVGGMPAPTEFCVGVSILAVITSGLSALIPLWQSARRDPVSVMRTP